jgi:hypothetical protein
MNFQNSSMPHKTSCKYILLSDFMENGIFSDFSVNKYGKPPVCGAVFVYSGELGG